MKSSALSPPTASAWPHRLAVLLVCATALLIWVGGLVTSTDAGMAVPDWPTTYGYNLFLYPWQTWFFGPWDLFIEHGHRLLASAIGLLAIALVLVVIGKDARSWVRLLALAVLGLVIVQGIVGGLRVRLDARVFAMAHGCLGPLFFAAAVAVAAVTSRWWREPPRRAALPADRRLQRMALLTVLLVYVQLVVGAQLRHIPVWASPGVFRVLVLAHLALAAVVLGHTAGLAVRVARNYRPEPLLRRPAWGLMLLVLFQIGLGLATWIVKFAWPVWLPPVASLSPEVLLANGWSQAVVPTAHTLAGSLILGLALLLLLRSGRLLSPARTTRAASRLVREPAL